MNFLRLESLRADLLPAVLELDAQCFGQLWTREAYQRELDSPNSTLLALTCSASLTAPAGTDHSVTETEGQRYPVRLLGLGCLWSILEEAHITILAVHPSYRRQGLGQVLLQALLSIAQQQGLERATLEVRASNQSALSLYQKFGFQEVGRRRRYYSDTGEDALILWLNGLQQPDFAQKLRQWQQQSDAHLVQAKWRLQRYLPQVVTTSFFNLTSRL